RKAVMTLCDWYPVHQIPDRNRNTSVVRGHTVAKLFHAPDAFVSQDDRKWHLASFPRDNMGITATYSANDHAYQVAARLRLDDRHVPGLDPVWLDQNSSTPCSHDTHLSRKK